MVCAKSSTVDRSAGGFGHPVERPGTGQSTGRVLRDSRGQMAEGVATTWTAPASFRWGSGSRADRPAQAPLPVPVAWLPATPARARDRPSARPRPAGDDCPQAPGDHRAWRTTSTSESRPRSRSRSRARAAAAAARRPGHRHGRVPPGRGRLSSSTAPTSTSSPSGSCVKFGPARRGARMNAQINPACTHRALYGPKATRGIFDDVGDNAACSSRAARLRQCAGARYTPTRAHERRARSRHAPRGARADDAEGDRGRRECTAPGSHEDIREKAAAGQRFDPVLKT